MDAKSFELFPTLVMEFDLNPFIDIEQVNNSIRARYRFARTYGLFPNSKSSYPFEQFILSVPDLADLKKLFEQCLDQYCNKAGLEQHQISNNWFNYSFEGSEVLPHRHEDVSVSMTYYPSFPSGASDLVLTSPIVKHFIDGEVNFKSGVDLNNKTVFNMFEHRLDIKEGHLYIFPGWVWHHADKSQSGERIVIAANTQPTSILKEIENNNGRNFSN